ncbi:hypothetical protein GIB67_017385 [Kingdonia uniflora]|uniref:histidine kinase n=1 Tax=Kingdonia uniflora TaxID=39325 RepID=A0A7J7M477_9MAGN|nr:hypothetical protein GIB67_017385 [Kingdonia uniflora]
MLTHEIKSTLDRQTILKTTLVELGRTLTLEECALWMPTCTGLELQLSYILMLSTKRYAVMVLMLPSDSGRQWHVHELELIKVVANQVAVVLSHAAILEESMRARDHLAEQNVALDLARREPETTIRARNDFLSVMNHDMRTPMHAIIALYSLLQETELTAEQHLMLETVLKSSNLLTTLINDVLDLSRLEDRSLELDLRAFNLHSVFREVINLIKPIASVKKLFLSLNLAPDLLEYVVGDEKLLMQSILNVAGNAVKFSKEGSISVSVSVAKLKSLRDARAPAAGSSEEYLRIFSHEHKVVFTDVGISGMDGYEVVSVLQDRFLARHQRPLIIALTTNTDRATKDNCLRVGMDGVVLKPVSLEKMRSVYRCFCRMGLFVKRVIENSIIEKSKSIEKLLALRIANCDSSSQMEIEQLDKNNVNPRPISQGDPVQSRSLYHLSSYDQELPVCDRDHGKMQQGLEAKGSDNLREGLVDHTKDKSNKEQDFYITNVQTQAPVTKNSIISEKLNPSKSNKPEKLANSKRASAPLKNNQKK